MITANKVEIRQSPLHGFGVFAKEDIDAGEVIEESPIFLTNIENTNKLHNFNDYFWSHDGKYILSFGLSSVFNNDEENPNCVREVFLDDRFYRFTVINNVSKDEEILISYK